MIAWFAAGVLLADNNLNLRLVSKNIVEMSLSNTDGIEGSQFSIVARGGIILSAYESGDRATASGFSTYQFLVNDSTLNVVLLAPFQSPLSPGSGVIGKIHLTIPSENSSDSVSVSVCDAKFADAQANLVEVSVGQLTWDPHTRNNDKGFALDQNFPNPFNPATTISYTLTKPDHVLLTVFDVTGRIVRSLVDQYQSKGKYSIAWSAGGGNATGLASGVYFARLQVGPHMATRKMIYAK